jgi:hypothetical protein
MRAPERRVRRAFRRLPFLLVRVTPKGFSYLEEETEELSGRIVRLRLVRKLFEDQILTCFSRDGLRARDGTLCEDCAHPRCQPQVRIHLQAREAVFVIDLAYSAARKLLVLKDELANQEIPLEETSLRLTVQDRGRWGEVGFERV